MVRVNGLPEYHKQPQARFYLLQATAGEVLSTASKVVPTSSQVLRTVSVYVPKARFYLRTIRAVSPEGEKRVYGFIWICEKGMSKTGVKE